MNFAGQDAVGQKRSSQQCLFRCIIYLFLSHHLQNILRLCPGCNANGKVRFGRFFLQTFRIILYELYSIQQKRFFRTQRQILDSTLGVIVWKELTEVDFFSNYIWDGLAMMITNLEEVCVFI